MGDDPLCGPSGPSNTPPVTPTPDPTGYRKTDDLSTLCDSNLLRLLIKNLLLQAHSPSIEPGLVTPSHCDFAEKYGVLN
jgi:hypothetical protein